MSTVKAPNVPVPEDVTPALAVIAPVKVAPDKAALAPIEVSCRLSQSLGHPPMQPQVHLRCSGLAGDESTKLVT